MKHLQIRINDDLHKKFKRKCFDKEIEMSTLIRLWIEKFVDKT